MKSWNWESENPGLSPAAIPAAIADIFFKSSDLPITQLGTSEEAAEKLQRTLLYWFGGHETDFVINDLSTLNPAGDHDRALSGKPLP